MLALLCGGALARVEVPVDVAAGYVPRVVVELRADAQGVSGPARVARIARETGVPLVYQRTLAMGADLVTSPTIAGVGDADGVAATLLRHPDVVYAGRTHRVHAARAANDPLFANQFYLQPGPFTIDAPAAWDVTAWAPRHRWPRKASSSLFPELFRSKNVIYRRPLARRSTPTKKRSTNSASTPAAFCWVLVANVRVRLNIAP